MIVLVNVKLRLVPLEDVILPPATSKVLKYVLLTKVPRLKNILLSRKPFKPLRIGMLYRGGKPLYSKYVKGGGKPIHASRGESLTTSYCLGVEEDEPLIEELMSVYGVTDTPYGRFDVEVLEVEVVNPKAISAGVGKVFRLLFKTPTVLTAKHMIPPPLKVKASRIPSLHKLVPQPSFIFSYLLKLWNNVFDKEYRIPSPSAGDWEAYKLGRIADITLVEIDYNVRPVTVILGSSNGGRLRLARGFTGWVTYEVLSKRMLRITDRLLGLANLLGIGRSRGIGLGEVGVTNYS